MRKRASFAAVSGGLIAPSQPAHAERPRNSSRAVPFYVGVGARLVDGHDHHGSFEHDHSRAGVRIPVGLAMVFRRVPLDLFTEFVPTIDVIDGHDDFSNHDRFHLSGAFGARYWF